MERAQAVVEWLREAEVYDQQGDDYRADLARYFAAAASGDPAPSRFAPLPLRRGFEQLDVKLPR